MTSDARRQIARAMSEDDLEDAIIGAAGVYGWLVHHSRRSRNARGQVSTAIKGDPGLPDLILVHPRHGVLFRELKTMRGTVSADQRLWLDALSAGGADVDVWNPEHWIDGTVDRVLRGGRRDLVGPTAPGIADGSQVRRR